MKLSIGSKVLGLLGISTAVGLGVALMSYQSTVELVAASGWVSHTYEVIQRFDDIKLEFRKSEAAQRGYIITTEESYLAPTADGRVKIDASFNALRKLTDDNPHQQSRLDTMRPLIDAKFKFINDSVEARRGSFEAARKLIASNLGRNYMDQITTLIDQGIGEENELLAKRVAESKYYARTVNLLLLFGAALFAMVFVLTTLYVRRGIVAPLVRVMSLANAIASGDLKQKHLVTKSGDEIGELAVIFNGMLDYLRQFATQSADVARNLGTAASEILAAIQQQAAAVREQASAIQQTTTTMEEIGQSGAQVNERGRQISVTAEASLGAANAGIGAVQSTNMTMVSIRSQVESVAENIVNLSERNQTIGEIIATVNDIAEQSNLLSLNAAIEAADAGDHGRRFSVVANELKNLSEQAKGATVQVRLILGEIQKGINTSVMLTEEAVKRAEGGKLQADIAEKTIMQLTGTTSESVKTFQQIVGATNQQQIGFEQITQALRSIRIGADQTAASTSQLEKAALSLNTLGQKLQETTQRYQI